MSIQHIILGFLSKRPMTGYDLKKIISDSEILPWSANNNQIYRALVTLHEQQWVTKEIESQVGSPNRHIYSITSKGKSALKRFVLSEIEAPEAKNSFFHQLLWADNLDKVEIDTILDAYLNRVGEKLFFLRVQLDERPNFPDRTEREKYLWEMIYKNWIAHYEMELKWVRQMRAELFSSQ